MKPRILVCGGRDFDDAEDVFYYLDRLVEDRGWIYEKDEYGNFLPCVHIIHGGARGADTCADDWAVQNWCPVEVFLPEWDKYGKRAGYLRNKRMLDEGQPDLVLAFPGGKGTAMMVDIARKAGVEVIEIE